MGDTQHISSWIGGQPTPEGGPSFENHNPATGEILSWVEAASEDLVERAVQSATDALPAWRTRSGAERGRILTAAAAALRARNDELARLEVLDVGKPLAEARAVDVASAADCLEYFGGLAASLHGQHVNLGDTAFGYTRREPLGVCAGIGAWNYPLQVAAWKAGPALAAGNTMVFKPSELTPTSADQLARLFSQVGLPPGVFNVVQGAADTGRALVAHPGIAKVSLTGEVSTGRTVMASAAATLKHVTLELGGKSPLVVFDDADLRNAVSAALLGNFYTQGEVCSNCTRVFVHDSIHDDFVQQVQTRAEAMKIGDPMSPTTDVGSLISREHLEKVLGYIELGQTEGARLVTGGRRVTKGALAQGFFVEPTVFADCRDDMRIAKEEIFGPVMCILRFEDEDEVVRRANDTPFGLAAGVFTRDLARAHRVVARLDAGTCWINNFNITPIELPFGGNKQSGIGRENSPAALDAWTQLKSVYVELGDVDAPY
jgi:betaine-aldehyde dehydrogenase